MERLHIAFPVSLCKDILESKIVPKWRTYEASIFSAGNKKEIGAVHARVTIFDNEEVVNIYLTCKKFHFVKGKLDLRVGDLKEATENNDSTIDVDDKMESSAAADDLPSECNHSIDIPMCSLLHKRPKKTTKTLVSEKDLKTSSNDSESKNRPNRRRATPSRFKDFDVDFDRYDQKRAKCEPNKMGGDSKCLVSADEDISSFMKGGKKRQYGKLINNLTLASLKSGSEIQSILSSLKISLHKNKENFLSEINRFEETVPDLKNEEKHFGDVSSQSRQNFTIIQFKAQNSEACIAATENQNEISKQSHVPYEDDCLNSEKSPYTSNRSNLQTHSSYFHQKSSSEMSASLYNSEIDLSTIHIFKETYPNEGPSDELPGCRRIPSVNSLSPRRNYKGEETLIDDDDDLDVDYIPDEENTESDLDTETDKSDIRKKRRNSHVSTKSPYEKRPGQALQCVASMNSVSEGHSATLDSSNADTSDGQFQILVASTVVPGDQFFIPQTAILVNGQPSSLLVGPFRVVGEGALTSLQLVPQEERNTVPPCILQGDLVLSSGIVKGMSAGMSVRVVELQTGNSVSVYSEIQSRLVATDHDYIGTNRHAAPTPKVLKTLAKPISLAQHIFARVERVEEEDGNCLVTISGHNSKASPAMGSLCYAPKLNADGMPIVHSIEEVMTDTLIRTQKYRESYNQALEAKPTPPEYISINDLVVHSEVVLAPAGHSYHSKYSKYRHQGRGRPRKRPPLPPYFSANCFIRQSCGTMSTSSTYENFKGEKYEENLDVEAEETKAVDSIPGIHNIKETTTLFSKGLFGVNFTPGEVIDIEENSDTLLKQNEHKSPFVMVEEIRTNPDFTATEQLFQSSIKVCKYCLRLFPASFILYNHVKSAHAGNLCDPSCHQYMEDLQSDTIIICPYCPERNQLSNEYTFRAHLAHCHRVELGDADEMTVQDVSSFQCEICQVYFNTLGEFEAHATLLHNTQLLQCSQCSLTFTLENSLNIHALEVHGEVKAKHLCCKTCGETFDNRAGLLIHRDEVHSMKKHLFCHHCDFTTGYKAVLSRHCEFTHGAKQQRQLIGKEKRTLTCPKCSRHFKSTLVFHKHLASKHQIATQGNGEKGSIGRIKCTCCLSRFSTFWEMQEHRRHIHTGPIPVHCVFCGQGYQSAAPMYNHIKKHHLQTETHSCSFCHAGFLSRQDLVSHLDSVHSMQVSDLLEQKTLTEQHRVAGGSLSLESLPTVLPVRCPYCCEVFIRMISLVAHIVEGHWEHFPHACSHCEQYFINEKALKYHMKDAHDEESTKHLSPPRSPSPLVLQQSAAVSSLLLSDHGFFSTMKSEPFDNEHITSETNNLVQTDLMESLPEETQTYIRTLKEQGKHAVLIVNDANGVQRVSVGPDPTLTASNIKQISSSVFESCLQSSGSQYLETFVPDNITVGIDVITEETESAIENLVNGMHIYGSEGQYETRNVVNICEGRIINSLEMPASEENEEGTPVMDLSENSEVAVQMSESETVVMSAEEFLRLLKESEIATE